MSFVSPFFFRVFRGQEEEAYNHGTHGKIYENLSQNVFRFSELFRVFRGREIVAT
jgi:hypothetical protein